MSYINYFLTCSVLRVVRAYPISSGNKAGTNPGQNGSPLQSSHTHSPHSHSQGGNLDLPFNLLCTSVGRGTKPEYLGKTREGMRNISSLLMGSDPCQESFFHLTNVIYNEMMLNKNNIMQGPSVSQTRWPNQQKLSHNSED